MAPPELAADAPVVDVLHPVEVGLLVLLRGEVDGLFAVRARLDGGDGFLGERLDLDEPLRGEARLDDGFAAVAVAYVVDVVLDASQKTLGFEVGDDFLAGYVTVESGVGAAFGVDVAGIVHHVDGGKIVALAECEIVGIVGGVTLTAPVPNSRLTHSSRTMGISRFISGRRSFLPWRCR